MLKLLFYPIGLKAQVMVTTEWRPVMLSTQWWLVRVLQSIAFNVCVFGTENKLHRRRNDATIYLVYFPVSGARSLPDGDRVWIPKPAFGSSNQLVDQCRSVLHHLYFRAIFAGEDNPLLSPPQFIDHPILVGDWIHYYLDDLAGSKSELDNGSHFTGASVANRYFTICWKHCDYKASEFWTLETVF